MTDDVRQLLEDYERLLRYLAEQREHSREKDKPCRSVGACMKCDMLAKADRIAAVTAERPPARKSVATLL